MHQFLKRLAKSNQTSPLLNYIKGNTSRFGSAIQVLPSDTGKYFSLFLITAVVVVFISMFFDHTVVVVVFIYLLIL